MTPVSKNFPLPAPPENENYVRFIPLGGLDEIGMNCAIVECNGSMLLVDCGLTFPDSDSFGIDQVLPDWSWVLDNLDKLDAVLLTHGHEDHIGAMPYFLKEVDVPVYSGRLTLGMLRKKLEEHGLASEVDLYPVEPGERLAIGPFVAEFIHVNHSIPNAMAIALETPLGRLLFTGDWRVDHSPLYEPPIDLHRFAELGRDGVLALMGDSTNAEVPGFSLSERVVQQGLGQMMEDTNGRIIIAQFSSNLYRVAGLLALAHRFGRKVVLLGRSLSRNFGLARELGHIPLPADNIVIQPQEMDRYDERQLLIITTGSQAEPRSALTRMSYGDHHQVTINSRDTVVLSARQIPGNESSINEMLNNLIKRGARLVTADDATIHGSGHGKQEELKLMLHLTRPKYLVPVHGDYRMRQRHARIGKELGVPNQLVIENGDVLEFRDKGAQLVGRVHSGRILVDGQTVGDGQEAQLRDRRQLASAGIIVAFCVVDRSTGELASGPDIVVHGVRTNAQGDDLVGEATQAARRGFDNLPREMRRDGSAVREAIRVEVRRVFRRKTERKPVVISIVHEL